MTASKDNIDDPKLSEKIQPRTVQTLRGVVEYAEVGSGPAVVTLHGAMGGYDQSLMLAQAIGAKGYRYIAVTRPGYLGTPISSGRTPSEQADLLAALLDVLAIDRAGVMAVSGGGPIALEFGLKYPDRCCGLVLASTCAGKTEMKIPAGFKMMTALARQKWFGSMMLRKMSKDVVAVAKRSISHPDILNRTINDSTIWPLFSTMLLSTYRRMEQRIDGTMNDIEITRTQTYPLEDLHRPVLVIHGTDDPLLDFEAQTNAYKTRLPNVEIIPVEKGEHVAIFTHRDEILPRVAEFMQANFTG